MKLKEILSPILTIEELRCLVGSYDVLGDIAIIIIPEELAAKEQTIAAAILADNPRIKVVGKRAANYGGEFRTLPIEIIGGENRKETEVKEFGVRLRLDVERVYFSVRSGNERKRIASLVGDGEEVLVLFSGIGPYPLMISKYSRAKKIVGIEKNPLAHAYALKNLKLNKKCTNIELIPGDVQDCLTSFTGRFDRIVMPLPKSADKFLGLAVDVLKPGGYLHFYDMQDVDSFDNSLAKVQAASFLVKRCVKDAKVVACGHCAPRTHRICIDCLID